MKRKAKIWHLVIASLMVFLTVGPAAARDEIIGTWDCDPGFCICYDDPMAEDFLCFYFSTITGDIALEDE